MIIKKLSHWDCFALVYINRNTNAHLCRVLQDSKVHAAHIGPTWVMSAPGRPMLTPWTLLSGLVLWRQWWKIRFEHISYLGNNTEPWPSNQPHLTCSTSDEPPTCHEVDVCTIRPLKRSEWLHLPYVFITFTLHSAHGLLPIADYDTIYMGIKHCIKLFYLSFCSLLDTFFCIFDEFDIMWHHSYEFAAKMCSLFSPHSDN